MNNRILVAFLAIAFLELFAEATADKSLVWVSKPLLMPLLAAWFWSVTRQSDKAPFRLMIGAALLLSALGDILLMFPGELFFLSGLVSFLLVHAIYCTAFTREAGIRNGFLRRHFHWAAPFLLGAAALLFCLWDGIPDSLKFPVCLYASVLTAMVLSVVNLRHRMPDPYFFLMLAGAVNFWVSDSLITISKFAAPFDYDRIAVMSTYIFGQFLLIWGAAQLALKRT